MRFAAEPGTHQHRKAAELGKQCQESNWDDGISPEIPEGVHNQLLPYQVVDLDVALKPDARNKMPETNAMRAASLFRVVL
ncbi:MAG TPA: hypothetical protein VD736_00300 [Nitrososphaera sp.]|nr:hypothetical protein [Nitrososphaera sp.]